MPIYEYACSACGHRLEAIQKMSEAPLTHCPACGKPELKKLLSAAGFQLKGSGWYQTDFKDKGKTAAPKETKETKETADSGDSKPTGGCGGGCTCH